MKKRYTIAKLFATKVCKFFKMKTEQLHEIWNILRQIDKNIDTQMVELLKKPAPTTRIVVSFLETASAAERIKTHRFVDTMQRLGCIVLTQDSELRSANGNTYAIASIYIDSVAVWKIRLGKPSTQNEVSKIIL